MKKYIKPFNVRLIQQPTGLLNKSIIFMALVIGLLGIGCDNKPVDLKAPSNIKIDVVGRTTTITWDAEAHASGYEIIAFSEGCASGKRKINTLDNTAVSFDPSKDPPEGTSNMLKNDKSSGAVEILDKTKVQITLMPRASAGSEPMPMARAITVKVKSLGGTVKRKQYLDSDYSETVRKGISSM